MPICQCVVATLGGASNGGGTCEGLAMEFGLCSPFGG